MLRRTDCGQGLAISAGCACVQISRPPAHAAAVAHNGERVIKSEGLWVASVHQPLRTVCRQIQPDDAASAHSLQLPEPCTRSKAA